MLPALVNNYKTYKLTQYLKHVVYKFTKLPTSNSACNSFCFPEINYFKFQASLSYYNGTHFSRYDNTSFKLEGQTPAFNLNNFYVIAVIRTATLLTTVKFCKEPL